MLLAALALLVWGVGSMLGGGDDTRPAASSTDEAAPESEATEAPPEPTVTRLEPGSEPRHRPGRGEHDVDRRPTVVSTELAAAEGGCLAEDVRVVPNVAGPATSGTEVPIGLTLTTASPTACRLELDADALLLSVSTDGASVWSTEQCPSAVAERTVVLRPGWLSAADVVWPGVPGDRGCTGTTRDAPPGAYAVEAALYAGEPARAEFALLAPERTPRGDDSGGDRPAQDGRGRDPGRGGDDQT